MTRTGKKDKHVEMHEAPIETNLTPRRLRATITSFGSMVSPTATLRKMKIGDSFLVDDKRGRNSVACAAYRLDIKITTEREGNKFRIYRTE